MHNGTFYINSEIKSLLFFIEMFSAILLILVAIGGMIRSKRKNHGGSYVFMVAGSIAFVLLCDVGAIESAGKTGTVQGILSYASNYGYFFFNNLTIWSVTYYLFEMIRKNGTPIKQIWNRIVDFIMVFATLSLAVNVYTGYLFYFDDYNYYQRGPVFLFSQIPAGIGLVILTMVIVKYRNSLTSAQRVTISSCVALPAIAEGLQIVIYGFSWLPLSMDIACFSLLAQYMINRSSDIAVDDAHTDTEDAKKTRARLLVIGLVSSVFFFSAVTKITVSVAADQVGKEIDAHYEILMENVATQASMWLEEEYQLVNSQKNAIQIIDNYEQDFLTTYLTRVAENYSEDETIYDIYFVNIDNQMSSGMGYVPEESIDFRKRSWYRDACKTKGICFNQPYKDSEGDDAIVTLSTMVDGTDGSFKGVLAVDILVNGLCETIMNQDLPEDSYMIILDKNHRVLSYPGYEYDFRQDNTKVLNDLFTGYTEIIDYLVANDGSQTNPKMVDYDGLKRAFFAKQIPNCNWYVISAISTSEMDVTEKTLMESIVVSLIVYLVMGVIIALWATNGVIQKLRIARMEANAASEAKSSFLANMSHEIRTPINAVLGMDEILLRECTDENVKEYALNIQSAGQSLLGIINEILDFSKIESGKLDIINNEYSLAQLIGATRNLIEIRAKNKNLDFAIERSEYLPARLIGDENRVRQIMVNFLTNAVKYTSSGSVTLRVEFEKTDKKHGNLKIAVKDTGMGISEESMKVLFDSFQRVDESKNRNIEGTGLGLAITKQLAELMGGSVSVESEYGKGSTFTAVIPQIIQDDSNLISIEQAAVSDVAGKAGKTEDDGRFEGVKIVVVDDVEMNLKVFRGLLKKTGITIDSATNGDDAIELIGQNSYDVIFLDHMMPGKDGIETFNELKDRYSDRIKDVPVIMLTANAISGVEKKYMELGFDGYLSKPIVRDKLIETIANIIKK